MHDRVGSVRFLFIRHAQAEFGAVYGGLTDVGAEQARMLGGFLVTRGVDGVFASPALRAIETARALAAEPGLDVRLMEFDFGPNWLPLTEAVATEAHLALWQAGDRAIGGESLEEFQVRVNAVLDEMASGQHGHTLAVFTHAGVIDAALRWAYNLPVEADWVTEAEVRNASITEIERWPRGKQSGGAPFHSVIYRVGDVSHLPPGLHTDY